MANEFKDVVVTDIKMPFGSMVVFMVKWAIATITFGILNAIFGRLHQEEQTTHVR